MIHVLATFITHTIQMSLSIATKSYNCHISCVPPKSYLPKLKVCTFKINATFPPMWALGTTFLLLAYNSEDSKQLTYMEAHSLWLFLLWHILYNRIFQNHFWCSDLHPCFLALLGGWWLYFLGQRIIYRFQAHTSLSCNYITCLHTQRL